MKHVLVARADGLGDVLLAGPAVRAVAASGATVTMLTSPAGAPAAERLPGVRSVIVARLPWIDACPEPVKREPFDELVAQLQDHHFAEAILFTSFHQSPLPLALACRLAGIEQIAAISNDYPGALLDVRHLVDDNLHEVERNLSLVAASGYKTSRDDLRLAVTTPISHVARASYVVVHPGATVPARTFTPRQWRATVRALRSAHLDVIVSGGRNDVALTRYVAGCDARDRGGATGFDSLVRLLAGARAVVVGNTGPAHIAAAVGTPVVSIFAPTVPAARWHPWMVPHVLLGDQAIACAGCRSRACPLPQQSCLAAVRPAHVIAALAQLEQPTAVAV